MTRILMLILLAAVPQTLEAQETFHLLAQFADGRFPDGTSYRSTLMITPWFNTDAPNCKLTLYGMTTSFDTGATGSSFDLSIPTGGFFLGRTTGTQVYQGGYGTLLCSHFIHAQVLYTFYGPDGAALSEATVFSSKQSFEARLIVDHRDGARLGFAVANNTDVARSYTLTLTGSFGTRNGTLNVPARRNIAGFVDDLLPNVPANAVGLLRIRAIDFSHFGAIGLRYTGIHFTTIPAN